MVRHFLGSSTLLPRSSRLAGAAPAGAQPGDFWGGNPGRRFPVGEVARAILLGLAGAALFLLLLPTSADTDIWGHVRFGQDLLAGGPLRPIDHYSYLTAGNRWINHETLAEVIFALAFSAAGGAGLVALKVMIIIAIAALIIVHYRRVGANGGRIVTLLLPATILAWPRFSTIRPQLFTALFFTVTLWLLLRVEERKDTRCLWLLPPLFAVWVNTHGGVLIGIAFLATWALSRVLLIRAVEWRVALPVALSLLALLANPYLLQLPLFLLRTATEPRPDIGEWQRLHLTSVFGAAYLTLAGLVALGAYRRGLPSSGRLVMLIAALVLPLVAERHADLCALGIALLGRDELLAALAHHAGRSRPINWAMAGLSSAVAGGLVAAAAPGSGCLHVHPGGMEVPLRAVGILRAAGVEANMAVPFRWGEYVIWQLGPRVRVSLDGRRETVYGTPVLQANLDLESGRGDWYRLARDARTQLVLMRRASPAFQLLLPRPEWTLAYVDDQAVLFARSGSESLSRIRAAAARAYSNPEGGRCFAAPGR